ncbi:MAG: hypothetical protein ABSG53_03400 [Thermoguttaceae bacterium]
MTRDSAPVALTVSVVAFRAVSHARAISAERPPRIGIARKTLVHVYTGYR